MNTEKKLGSQRGEYLVKSLSSNLKEELMIDAFGKYIKEIKLFKKNFSQKLLNELSKVFEEITFAPDDIIFKVIFI